MENSESQPCAPHWGGLPKLRVENLTVSASTESGRFDVVKDVSLTLTSGQVTGLAGESGSGKSLTALSIMGLLEPRVLRTEKGTVLLDDIDLLRLRRKRLRRILGDRVSMIFQEPMTSLDPMMRIGTSVGEVVRAHTSLTRRETRRRVIELLDRVGIPDPASRYDAYPFEMSGGMLQRVLIAMAMSCRPEVLIADEPTTALDVTVQSQIMQLLREVADTGTAVLLVTHDMGVISEYTDDLTIMYAGQVIESGPTQRLIANPRHPYTAGLLASVPSTRRRADRLEAIPGQVPAVAEMPTGCRFTPRCPFATPACHETVQLTEEPGSRAVRCVRRDELELAGVT